VEQKQKIGRYEIVDRVGRGMQGTVYKAHDPELDRLVAIKLLHTGETDGLLEGAGSRPAIPLEARISSKLRHPNIVSIFDYGQYHNHQFLVFEYVEGQTLRQMLGSQGSLSIVEICRLAAPIIDAIAYAHGEGVVHLDLSPRNILVDRNRNPRIMDFGLSQFSQSYVQQGDEIKGTPLYMSPEYFNGTPLGPYTDVYALGASFYQLVVGEPAVGGTTISEIANAIKHGSIDFGRLPAGEHKEGFTAVLKSCLEKDYRRRVQNGGQLKQVFDRFLTQHPVAELRHGQEVHSTVQFLLRRMQRKSDFPSISRVLNDINRMTGEGNSASAEKLANVILRDYALTNKLLKTVNSAFFGRAGGDVTSVSKAIVVLGAKNVRNIANSLAYFSRIKGGGKALRDAMVRSFLSGLLTRHLVQRARAGDAEEGFICGLFRNLGENLTAYYFPEDHGEIAALARRNRGDQHAASRQVLGVSYGELGGEVASIWGLPASIILAIRSPGSEPVGPSATPDELLRDRAVFANALCAIVDLPRPEEQDEALDLLLGRFGKALGIDRDFVCRLFAAGMDKLAENADMLEFDYAGSPFSVAARAWVDRVGGLTMTQTQPQPAPRAGTAASASN
jgi:serine/threonine protein kinase